ncbi:hypothetical protein CC86DRAFT_3998 [Ophiobolus disseminans]|uniref:Uncharacterized protein n=1 Tax=Ophiobolus disseminans TaxID=1469910 RepID=A0A6A7AKB6_9PLEO|nr:hypothetical protein CC86DRAFT_3998 [Ophiobolus disseminans]
MNDDRKVLIRRQVANHCVTRPVQHLPPLVSLASRCRRTNVAFAEVHPMLPPFFRCIILAVVAQLLTCGACSNDFFRGENVAPL